DPVVVIDGRICSVEAFGAEEWLSLLVSERTFPVSIDETADVLMRLADAGPLPRIAPGPDAPPLPIECTAPIPRARITRQRTALLLDVVFAYGPGELPLESGQRLALDIERGVQCQRDLEREAQVSRALDTTDGLTADDGIHGRWFIDPGSLDDVVAELLDRGFEVMAEDRPFRSGTTPSLVMQSGIDWFEVLGTVEFGDGGAVPVTRLVEAWRKGRKFVELDDGSKGLVPGAWLEKVGGVLGLGQDVDGRVRFHRAQAALLEPLAAEAGIKAPEELATLLRHLRRLAEPSPYTQPPGFHGELRPYQEVGVGWMRTLAIAGLGGCLADDMGLGKTVQALAFLLSLETDPIANTAGPVLIVAPRSLLWNWASETTRFVPGRTLRIHHGPRRAHEAADIGSDDWVMTTYGTLQRDVQLLGDIKWSVVILDEAQAIKNPRSRNAAAVGALAPRVRLALTGTPVENHARDLWSLVAFLDPGLLGTERRFLERTARNADPTYRTLLARTIAPLILRRTKEQVAPELPPRIEQTILVPLSDQQQELYEKLRKAGARALSEGLDDGTARMNVLEVLLRLRQVACHPGLIDPSHTASGKIDLLIDELVQVTESGHKALVFSQFVKLLDLVAPRLEADGVTYTRLDGKTRDRQSAVRRFQEEDDCAVMLVSLKAGGHGLNLTAADYVFLLDPWWNPAVEAQAIDRAHRIGRSRKVIAYRLVARGTVEERILDLQREKRELAEALIDGARGPLADLTVEDLAILLA
ncbi:MAG: DEAD/DEAH box helicase, partial [Planctomycetes bacterium]|nr:DEAD/DEAH box helicase [Planctomycetota bacterium]